MQATPSSYRGLWTSSKALARCWIGLGLVDARPWLIVQLIIHMGQFEVLWGTGFIGSHLLQCRHVPKPNAQWNGHQLRMRHANIQGEPFDQVGSLEDLANDLKVKRAHYRGFGEGWRGSGSVYMAEGYRRLQGLQRFAVNSRELSNAAELYSALAGQF